MKKANNKSLHPDHGVHKKRLNRVRGQIDGIEKMIDERRYCPDILIQLRAAAKALESIEAEIMQKHIHGCVKTAIKSRDENAVTEKIDEIMMLVKR
ncbi:metal-sensitive transcriptional regulator [Bdellovibrio sp. SKB1291214]|uniref:metal-sensitive transcriptional regulator n=1 Tax=unclassified Bdellovibrio TaxID=2633795 RepID=UPI000B51888B|nr:MULTISPECIES: metal-sensitive transcriptional regulator [unclassified Bdellovibrio]QDK44642.1 transcriptional regulator [Bdellovibrio sp. ZAP7]UYL07440.1 metal-sensitive transcriptional regulator [Bdellovibrio sp. SKB1291214]